MKKFIFMAALALMTALSFNSCERVDAGHEGILVNLYGSVPSVITGGNSHAFLDISKFK